MNSVSTAKALHQLKRQIGCSKSLTEISVVSLPFDIIKGLKKEERRFANGTKYKLSDVWGRF